VIVEIVEHEARFLIAAIEREHHVEQLPCSADVPGLASDIGGMDVVTERFGNHALRLVQLAHVDERLAVELVSIDDFLERENGLIVLAVRLIDAAGFEQRGDVLEVAPAQNVDEFRERVLRAPFDDVRLPELEQHVDVDRIEFVRGHERLTRARHVRVVVQEPVAGLEIRGDRVVLCTGCGKHPGCFEPRFGAAIDMRHELLQSRDRTGIVFAIEADLRRREEGCRPLVDRTAIARALRAGRRFCHRSLLLEADCPAGHVAAMHALAKRHDHDGILVSLVNVSGAGAAGAAPSGPLIRDTPRL
jgi:hypothetical protein